MKAADLATWANYRRGKTTPVAQQVYDQLKADFPDEAIKWVLSAKWHGPALLPLSQIDFSNEANWQASKDQDKVGQFADLITDGKVNKPIVLVNTPDNKKMIVTDGHHRAKAYKQAGKPALAYWADVDAASGPWDQMHASQKTGPSRYEGQP